MRVIATDIDVATLLDAPKEMANDLIFPKPGKCETGGFRPEGNSTASGWSFDAGSI